MITLILQSYFRKLNNYLNFLLFNFGPKQFLIVDNPINNNSNSNNNTERARLYNLIYIYIKK